MLTAGWFIFLIVSACLVFKAYITLWPATSWVSYRSHSFPGYLRARPGLNSSPTEGTNILWPFISCCAEERSEAYLWWLLLDIREEQCLVVGRGMGTGSWVVFTALPLTLRGKVTRPGLLILDRDISVFNCSTSELAAPG